MKYFYEKPEQWDRTGWKIYSCKHPMYNRCTLYLLDDGRGLSVIQKRFNADSKALWWGSIDPWIASDIFRQDAFKSVLEASANVPEDGLYPTMTVRQLMWKLRMKPLKKEYWEEF